MTRKIMESALLAPLAAEMPANPAFEMPCKDARTHIVGLT
jgi:hypothetical protein